MNLQPSNLQPSTFNLQPLYGIDSETSVMAQLRREQIALGRAIEKRQREIRDFKVVWNRLEKRFREQKRFDRAYSCGRLATQHTGRVTFPKGLHA